jgi:divalent metal cation (Fe/Co/Zn/Cd) transporter
MYKARARMQRQIKRKYWSRYKEAFRKTSDVNTLTALTEDASALAGIVIALVGLFLQQQTGNAFFDQISAVLIGIMLMGFALALAWENKRLLLGESLPRDEEQKLRDIITASDNVTDIVDFRTVYFGPKEVIVSADIAFAEGIETEAMDNLITGIEDDLKAANDDIRKVYIEPEARSAAQP